MRQQFAIGTFNAKALLVAFHAGEQHLARNLKIGGVKIGQQRHGMFHQPLHFIEQAVLPQHRAPGSGSLGVAAINNNTAALRRVNGDVARPGKGCQKVIGMGHSKGASTVDTVPAGFAPRGHGANGKGNHGIVE